MARRIPTIEVPLTADIPPGNITATEWLETSGDVHRLAYNTFDPSDPKYGGVRGAVDNAQRILNSNAINMAADDARDDGGILIIKGVFECAGGVQFQSHVDGRSGRLDFFDQSLDPAVLVGSEGSGVVTENLDVQLPEVVQMGKTGTGWAGTDTGVRLSNLYQCRVRVPRIRGFRTNLELYAIGGGNVYNEISLGMIQNGFHGMAFAAGTGGWVNQIKFDGGRFQLNSSEGTNITGARHIYMPDNSYSVYNNHTFINTSLEGNGPEYHVEYGGRYNYFLGCRWESNPPKILSVDQGGYLIIEGGYKSQDIEVTGSLDQSRITGVFRERWTGSGGEQGLMVLSNQSGHGMPVITVMPAGQMWDADPTTIYRWQISANNILGKAWGDQHPRIQIEAATGRVHFGDGTAAPTLWIGKTEVVPIDAIGTDGAFRVIGGYTRPLIIGDIYLWKNGSNVYKKVGEPPTSASDGTVAF